MGGDWVQLGLLISAAARPAAAARTPAATAAIARPPAVARTATATAAIARPPAAAVALPAAVVTAAGRLPRHLRHGRRQSLSGRLWVDVRVWDRLHRLRPSAPSRPASIPASVPSAAAAKALAAAALPADQTAAIRSRNRSGACDPPHYQLHCRGHH